MPWEANKEKVTLMAFPKMTVQQQLWNVLEHNHLALIIQKKGGGRTTNKTITRKLAD